jgi:hypothetical protein
LVDSANPVPEDVVTGTIKRYLTARNYGLRAGRAGEPQGQVVCVFTGRASRSKIFRKRCATARPRLRGGDDRLARAGPFVGFARSAQGLCPRFPISKSTSRPSQQVVLPIVRRRTSAHQWVAKMLASRARKTFVDRGGADGADDRSSRHRTGFAARARCACWGSRARRHSIPGGVTTWWERRRSSTIP